MQYVHYQSTALAVNEAGQTYGVQVEDGPVPDLTSVYGLAPDGSYVVGYALTTDMMAFSPDRPGNPSSVEEAEQWQAERDEKYPNGWDIPVFESDGVTQIGVFHIG